MPLNVYYAADANPLALKNRVVAVLGYGSQGRAHALNLRDSNIEIIVAQRPGGPNFQLARTDGFQPVSIADAVTAADVLLMALPDERMGDIFSEEMAPCLREGQTMGFLHGFAIRFGLVSPPTGVDVIMIAPKGPGSLVRDAFVRGGGLTCVLAIHQDATGRALETALAWGCGIGGGRGGMMRTTFSAECEADLFGEQVVLCGGVIELMKAAFDILVDAGLPEEVAYFECMQELKQITDIQYATGLSVLRGRISGTACYGGLSRGPRVIDERVRETLRAIFQEIQSGAFAKEWIDECRSGRRNLDALKTAESAHKSEAAGERVRSMAKVARD